MGIFIVHCHFFFSLINIIIIIIGNVTSIKWCHESPSTNDQTTTTQLTPPTATPPPLHFDPTQTPLLCRVALCSHHSYIQFQIQTLATTINDWKKHFSILHIEKIIMRIPFSTTQFSKRSLM